MSKTKRFFESLAVVIIVLNLSLVESTPWTTQLGFLLAAIAAVSVVAILHRKG